MSAPHLMSGLSVRLLTLPRPGAIGVIQLGGVQVWEAILARTQSLKKPLPSCPERDRLYMARWVDDSGEVDEVILAVQQVSGGEIVDICCHGGPKVVQRIVQSLQSLGARLGTASDNVEFGVPHAAGLIQRECDQLLVSATTRRTAMFLLRQRRALLAELRRIAVLAEQDAEAAIARLGDLSSRAEFGIGLTQGLRLALVGEVNAGKSKLCNALMGRQTSLTSEQAGTTRDWVSGELAIEGFPVTLFDTPGVRLVDDPLEAMAIANAEELVSSVDLVLITIDRSQPMSDSLRSQLSRWLRVRKSLIVLTKSDLPSAVSQAEFKEIGDAPWVEVSAATGMGLDRLRQAILNVLGLLRDDDHLPTPFTLRQQRCLSDYLDVPHDQRPSIGAWSASEFGLD